MRLDELFSQVILKRIIGDSQIDIVHITADSRKVGVGSLFVALTGDHVDGHDFVLQAEEQGATAVVVERMIDTLSITQVIVPSTKRIVALLAHTCYAFPAAHMTMIGVTGTNGKTTTTNFIERILSASGKQTGLIGTIEQRIGDRVLQESLLTTPQVIDLVATLNTMKEQNVTHVVMEASSHAITLSRLAGLGYRVVAFTNLTQDHLDFHQTMEAYAQAKGRLFSRLGNEYRNLPDGGLPIAVLNADDGQSSQYEHETIHQVITYGIQQEADVCAREVTIQSDGVSFLLTTFCGERKVKLQVTGRFNVYNALCATAVALSLGIELDTIVAALEQVKGVKGRFEAVKAGQPFTILVDYSHTPDSLENALLTIREFCEGKVITVVGAGGDRDKTKRPLMAKIAAKYSDVTVLTSDNPRTEDPEKILDDMESGIRDQNVTYERIVLRAEAIRHAILHAKENDVILIAGKGHENYQIIGTTKHHFDDCEIARAMVKEVYP